MNKQQQEIMDEFINRHSGNNIFGAAFFEINGVNFTNEQLSQRARELGWVNGYKYGVEYETNGKKPNLPNDVLVEARCYSNWLDKHPVSEWKTWETITAFRIVDERYRPVEDVTSIEVEQVQSDWYDYDKKQAIALPPVGIECEYLNQVTKTWSRAFIAGKHYFDPDAVIWCESDQGGGLFYGYISDFRPNAFARHITDEQRKADEERRLLIEVITSAGNLSEGMLADAILAAGFTKNKAAS